MLIRQTRRSKAMVGAWCIFMAMVMIVSPRHASGAEPSTLTELLDEAEALRVQGKWDEAIATLEDVVDRRQEDEALAATAQIRIGQYYLASGQPTFAEQAFQEAIDQFPDQREAQFKGRLYTIDALVAQQQLDEAMIDAQELLSNPSLTAEETMWTRVKRAEIKIAAGRRETAIEDLNDALTTLGETTAEPHNWARVRLAELYTHEGRFSKADQACESILTDQAEGRATDRQAIWALIWKARSRMFTNDLTPLTEAPEPARMAVALANESNQPDLAYEAQYLLGEIYGRLAVQAHRLVKEGQAIYEASPVAPIVEETRREQNYIHNGTGGPLMVKSMDHFGAAMNLALEFRLPGDKHDQARLQYATHMRNLGMGDKAIATLRLGIPDPAHMTESQAQVAQRIGEFLPAEEAEAWQRYLLDPAAHADPTAALVQQEYGVDPAGPSTISVSRPYLGHFWLGKLYRQQGKWREAMVEYEMAAAATERPVERLNALTERVRAASEIKNRPELLQLANQVAWEWEAVVFEAERPEDAHYAIHRISYLYETLGFHDRMFAALENLLASISPTEQPSRSLFARSRLMHEYVEYDRWDDAVILGEETLSLHLDTTFPRYHKNLCVKIGGLLQHVYEEEGNTAAADQVAQLLQATWPH